MDLSIEILDSPVQANSIAHSAAGRDTDGATATPPRFSLLNSVAAVFEQNRTRRQEQANVLRVKRQSEMAHSTYLRGSLTTSPAERAEAKAVVGDWAKKHDKVGNANRRLLNVRRRLPEQNSPVSRRPPIQPARLLTGGSTVLGTGHSVENRTHSAVAPATTTMTRQAVAIDLSPSAAVLSDDEDIELKLALAISLEDMGSTRNETMARSSSPPPTNGNHLLRTNNSYIPLDMDANSNVDLFGPSTSSSNRTLVSVTLDVLPDANRSAPPGPLTTIHRCSVLNCEAMFTSEAKLTQHCDEFNHSPCNPCLQILDFGLELKPSAYACPMCGEEYKSETKCRDHMCAKNHKSFYLPVPICAYLCPHCLVIFQKKADCLQHMTALRHFDISCPFLDDMISPKPSPVAVTEGFVQDFVVKCSKETFSIQCVDCCLTLERGQGQEHHTEHPDHILSASATSSPAEVIIQYLSFCTCDHCGVLLPPDKFHPGTIHHCLSGHQGKMIENDAKSFMEFVRKCGMRFSLPLIRGTANVGRRNVDSDRSISPVLILSDQPVHASQESAVCSGNESTADAKRMCEQKKGVIRCNLPIDQDDSVAGANASAVSSEMCDGHSFKIPRTEIKPQKRETWDSPKQETDHFATGTVDSRGQAKRAKLCQSGESSAGRDPQERQRPPGGWKKHHRSKTRRENTDLEVPMLVDLTISPVRPSASSKNPDHVGSSDDKESTTSQGRVTPSEDTGVNCEGSEVSTPTKSQKPPACQGSGNVQPHVNPVRIPVSVMAPMSVAPRLHPPGLPYYPVSLHVNRFPPFHIVPRPWVGQTPFTVALPPAGIPNFAHGLPPPSGVTRFSAKQPSQFHNPSSFKPNRHRPFQQQRPGTSRASSLIQPSDAPPSTEKLSIMKLIVFLDVDNWPSFFKKLPRSLPDMVFVWGFWGGATVWREPFEFPCFSQQKKKGLFHLNKKCGRTKDAADFALVLQVGKMDGLLPKSVAFTILSGDRGFCEVENQLANSERRVVVIDPHHSNKQSSDLFYTSIVSVFDA